MKDVNNERFNKDYAALIQKAKLVSKLVNKEDKPVGEMWETNNNRITIVHLEKKQIFEYNITRAEDTLLYETLISFWLSFKDDEISEFRPMPEMNTCAIWG